MKKISLLFFALFCMSVPVFSEGQSSANKTEFGIGSGYVFYGGDKTTKRIDMINDSSQFVIAGNLAYLIHLNGPVYLDVGGDILFDAHWNGGKHIYLWDYCGSLGFRIYPGLGGLACTVNYCLGRRSDFIELPGEPESSSTSWGNGFAFGIDYDFSSNTDGFAPEVGLNLRHMPRGDNSSDNILCVFLRLKG